VQFTLSKSESTLTKSSVFRLVPVGHLHEPCSFSVGECYLSVLLGTNCLLFEDGIDEASIPIPFHRNQ